MRKVTPPQPLREPTPPNSSRLENDPGVLTKKSVYYILHT